MTFTEIKSRVDQLGSAWEKFKEVNERRLDEVAVKGSSDPLTENHLSCLNKELEECKSRITSIEAYPGRPNYSSGNYVPNSYKSEHREAFCDYLRKGIEMTLPELEKKNLSAGTDNSGGYLASSYILDNIVQQLRSSSSMREICNVMQISADSLEYIEDNEAGTSCWLGEEESSSETSSASLSKKSIILNTIYAQPKTTQRLIDDVSVNIEEWLIDKITEAFATKENAAFINGDGSNKPKGILSYDKGTDSGQIEQIKSGTSSSFDSDALIKFYYSLKDVYANNASFLMNRTIVEKVRMLKDSNEQYIWSPGLMVGKPDTLLGIPLYTASDMPDAGVDSLSIVIADFKKAYQIVDNPNIRILRDYFTEKPFVKFYTTKRVGGSVINFDAIKIMAFST